MVSGSDPGELTVERALAGANVPDTTDRVLYRAQHQVPAGQFGRFATRDLVKAAHGLAVGDPMWLSATTPGAITATKPATAIQVGEAAGVNHYVFMGDFSVAGTAAANSHLATTTYWVTPSAPPGGIDGREWPTIALALAQAAIDLPAQSTVRIELAPGATRTLPAGPLTTHNYHFVGGLTASGTSAASLTGVCSFTPPVGITQAISFSNIQFADSAANIDLNFAHNQHITFVNCAFEAIGPRRIHVNVDNSGAASALEPTKITTVGCNGTVAMIQTGLGAADVDWTDHQGSYIQPSSDNVDHTAAWRRGSITLNGTVIKRDIAGPQAALFATTNPAGQAVIINLNDVTVNNESAALLDHTGLGVAPTVNADAKTRLNISAWGAVPTVSAANAENGGPTIKLASGATAFRLPPAVGTTHPATMAGGYDTYELGHGRATYSKEWQAIYGKIDVVELTVTHTGQIAEDAIRVDTGAAPFLIPDLTRVYLRVTRISELGALAFVTQQAFLASNGGGVVAVASGVATTPIGTAVGGGLSLTTGVGTFTVQSAIAAGWTSRIYVEFLPLTRASW